MPTSVRLDPGTDRALKRLAKASGQTKSAVVRRAIELLAAQEEERPYDTIADLIGCVRGGPSNLSEETGRKLREMLLQKRP